MLEFRHAYLSIFLVILATTGELSAQQLVQRTILDCSLGAPRINCVVKHSDGRTYVGGTLGRIGRVVDSNGTFEWNCLPQQDDIECGTSFQDTIVFAGKNGGVWYTTDGGWRESRMPNDMEVTSICKVNFGWCATTMSGQILKTSSLTHGQWTGVFLANDIALYGMASFNDTVVAVGSRRTILVSEDNGVSWQKRSVFQDTLDWHCTARLNNGTWIAGGDSATYTISKNVFVDIDRVGQLYPPYPKHLPAGLGRFDVIKFINSEPDGSLLAGGTGYRFSNITDGFVNYEAVFSSNDFGISWDIHTTQNDFGSGFLLPVGRCIGASIIGDNLCAVTSSDMDGVFYNVLHSKVYDADSLLPETIYCTSSKLLYDSVGNIRESVYEYYADATVLNDSIVLTLQQGTIRNDAGYLDYLPNTNVISITYSNNVVQLDTLYTIDGIGRSIHYDGTNVIIGCDSSIILVSEDFGTKWNKIQLPIAFGSVVSISGSLLDRVVVTVSGISSLDSWSGGALLVSSSSGANWDIVNTSPCEHCVDRLISISENRTGLIYFIIDQWDTTTLATVTRIMSIDNTPNAKELPQLPEAIRVNQSYRSSIDVGGSIKILTTEAESQRNNSVIADFSDTNWGIDKPVWKDKNNKEIRRGVLGAFYFNADVNRHWMVAEYGAGYYSDDHGANWHHNAYDAGGLIWRMVGSCALADKQLLYGTNGVLVLVDTNQITSVNTDIDAISEQDRYYVNKIMLTNKVNCNLELYDNIGNLIISTVALASATPHLIDVTVFDLNNSVYFYRLNDYVGNAVKFGRVLVAR